MPKRRYNYGGYQSHELVAMWRAMQQRCYNRNNKCYSLYGARGITVCDRWRENFANFLEDMGSRPTAKHTLDRINNDGNYEPSNCRWATQEEQARNKRSNRVLLHNGVKKTVAEWAIEYNLDYKTLYSRINQYKWDIGRALSVPAKLGNNQFNNK